jgi:hypothetical protein
MDRLLVICPSGYFAAAVASGFALRGELSIRECPTLLTKPGHVIVRGALGLFSGRKKAGYFGWRPIDAFVFIPLNLSLASVFVKPIMT